MICLFLALITPVMVFGGIALSRLDLLPQGPAGLINGTHPLRLMLIAAVGTAICF